jgi:hypothetical protein
MEGMNEHGTSGLTVYSDVMFVILVDLWFVGKFYSF